jgi:hypothetical protein
MRSTSRAPIANAEKRDGSGHSVLLRVAPQTEERLRETTSGGKHRLQRNQKLWPCGENTDRRRTIGLFQEKRASGGDPEALAA